MAPTGKGRRGVLIVAEAPGEQEDRRGVQLVGKAGTLLRETLERYLDVDIDRDCWKTNAVRCRPPDNRTPKPGEWLACREHLLELIKERQPKVVIPLGSVAIASLVHGRVDSPGPVERWRGMIIPDVGYGCWLCPTWHPSFMLRQEGNKPWEGVWADDLARAFLQTRVPMPKPVEPRVLALNDGVTYLTSLLEHRWSPIALDYETTGLRPYAKGHYIVSCGVAAETRQAVAFPMTPGAGRVWKKILADPGIKKIAHNMKFEHQWAARCLGVETRGWLWDSMQAAHMLDNRRGITGLKFQTYVNFGVPDYSTAVSPMLKDRGDGFNYLKDLDQLPREVLEYNALDAAYTFALWDKQIHNLAEGFK